MATFTISKSIEINALPDKVFQILNDYHHWPAWSPWVALEPDVKLTIQPDGKHYSWEGKRTGSGEMRIEKESKPRRLDMEVKFLKPWKSVSLVWFDLKPTSNGTEVTWQMTSRLPFFLFWMKKMMAAYIGMDYVRGLNMLKDYAESGNVPSSLQFKGVGDYKGCTYVGIRNSCAIDEIGPVMSGDFERLGSWAKDNADQVAGDAFCIYHEWDIVKNKATYTAASPVAKVTTALNSGMLSGTLPGCKVYSVSHKGPYRHLGNAWAAQYLLQRTKAYKHNKSIDPFEVYIKMPGDVSESEIETEVHFPMK